ncbi:protein kinase domain-containing protein [Legionella cardiaca]|uniref:Protein kinase domain-containing protein n=1 Tax=Legionella cardiaca TaxID=1071983 RepID=A0ABY8ATT0_9GAMM|nr:hypothetical protein [Legionella cardiaca]WED43186.1 hypothetical protein PXX05_15035 [Legionella cardiaca]
MGEIISDNKERRGTIFPVKQKDGKIIYYFSDFSESLGSGDAADVYKGYRCSLKKEAIKLTPYLIKKNDVIIQKGSPVAIKIYKNGNTPSPYRITNGLSALLSIEDRAVLIMEFIDGFEIKPDIDENPEIKKLTFEQAIDIAWQMVIGLNQLHYCNTHGPSIVHGDIKGSNLKIRITNQQETSAENGPKVKIDVLYLDDDYNKPIAESPQIAQGTPEHLALEILDGHYSEASDFFALGPLLLTLFGAKNPFKDIFKFKDKHPDMPLEALIKHYAKIGFCVDGLFAHFAIKPHASICNLLQGFIAKMVAKEKKQRPSPEAVLEFFTALRQWSLHQNREEAASYHLRLMIAANDTSWLADSTKKQLFFTFNENLQSRLISLMTAKERSQLSQLLKTKQVFSSSVLSKLATLILQDVNQEFSNHSPLYMAFFKHAAPCVELRWLLDCFENKDYAEYFSPKNIHLRKVLKDCKQQALAPVISIIVDKLAILSKAHEIQAESLEIQYDFV